MSTQTQNDSRPGTHQAAVGTEMFDSQEAYEYDLEIDNSTSRLTRKQCIEKALEDFFRTYPDPDDTPDLGQIEAFIVNRTSNLIDYENAARPKGVSKIPPLSAMTVAQAAAVIKHIIPMKIVQPAGVYSRQPNLLMTYIDDPAHEWYGCHVSNTDTITKAITKLIDSPSEKMIESVLKLISVDAEAVSEMTYGKYIPIKNGLFDYETKTVRPYDESTVTRLKFFTDLPYDKDTGEVLPVESPQIEQPDGTTWNVDDFIKEIANHDPQVEKLLWQEIAMVFRIGEDWRTMLYHYGPKGRNGKSTFNEIIRHAAGPQVVADITLDQLEGFMLSTLTDALVAIGDDNSGRHMTSSAVFKQLASNEVMTVDVKFERPRPFRFPGRLIQSDNKMMTTRDKSNAIYDRLTTVPFVARFDEDKANTAIKNDYVRRQDVSRYVLYRALVLEENFERPIKPAVVSELTTEMKKENDSSVAFAHEFVQTLAWDFVPTAFLYDLYKAWMRKENPSGRPMGSREFAKTIKPIFEEGGWEQTNTSGTTTMVDYEPTIEDYDITGWSDEIPRWWEGHAVTPPRVKKSQRGYRRVTAGAAVVAAREKAIDEAMASVNKAKVKAAEMFERTGKVCPQGALVGTSTIYVDQDANFYTTAQTSNGTIFVPMNDMSDNDWLRYTAARTIGQTMADREFAQDLDSAIERILNALDADNLPSRKKRAAQQALEQAQK